MLHVLQDWVELGEATGVVDVVQSGARWLDLSGFDNVTFWLEVRLVEGDPVLHYDTAPSIDPTLFKSMASVTLSASTSAVVTKVLLSQNPATPLAGLVRWRVNSPTVRDWRATFRIRCFAKGRRALLFG